MSAIGDTGQGATVVFDPVSSIGRVRGIQLPEWVMEKIDASALETVGFMSYIPGDLTDPGDCQIEAVFDSENDIPTNGVIETLTVTLPIADATNTVAGVLTGTGFITTTGLPNMAINELMTLNITFSFDGETGPAYTAEAAT